MIARIMPNACCPESLLDDKDNLPRIGLALGSGASRGWSHIGVIKALCDAGIEPDVVCGTSVGAMAGAAYLTGRLQELEDWVLGTTRADVLRFFDVKLTSTGFVDVKHFSAFLDTHVTGAEQRIESLPKKFAAVATTLATGRETWLTQGSLTEAVRASMAMPGLFPAVRIDGNWMVDGGLVNPIPVSVCHALGAEVVIAVNLNFGIVGKHAVDTSKPPGLFYAITTSIAIFENRITRSRLAGDPADVVLSPQVAQIGMLEFRRAGEAVEEGERCVKAALPEIRRVTGRPAADGT